MGHIAPEATKRMVSSGAVEGVEIDDTSSLQTCTSCELAKMTQKLIKKVWSEPRAQKFGDRIPPLPGSMIYQIFVIRQILLLYQNL